MKNVPVCIILNSGKLYLRTVPELEIDKNMICPDITIRDMEKLRKELSKEYNEEISSISIDWDRMNVIGIDIL